MSKSKYKVTSFTERVATTPYSKEIVKGAARAMFVTAWADAWERAVEDGEEEQLPWRGGDELTEVAPPTPRDFHEDAEVFVRTTAFDSDTNLSGMANAHKIDHEKFGFNLAMEGMGHGVGLYDLIEDHGLKISHIEPILDIEDVRKYGFEGLSATTGKFRVGERVQLHPGTDRWMMGDRYGEVVKVTSQYVHVKLDKSGKTLKFSEDRLLNLDGSLRGLEGGHRGGRIAEITKAYIREYSDSGQITAYVEWIDTNGKSGRTEGHPQGVHMRALLDRARREGVKVGEEIW